MNISFFHMGFLLRKNFSNKIVTNCIYFAYIAYRLEHLRTGSISYPEPEQIFTRPTLSLQGNSRGHESCLFFFKQSWLKTWHYYKNCRWIWIFSTLEKFSFFSCFCLSLLKQQSSPLWQVGFSSNMEHCCCASALSIVYIITLLWVMRDGFRISNCSIVTGLCQCTNTE